MGVLFLKLKEFKPYRYLSKPRTPIQFLAILRSNQWTSLKKVMHRKSKWKLMRHEYYLCWWQCKGNLSQNTNPRSESYRNHFQIPINWRYSCGISAEWYLRGSEISGSRHRSIARRELSSSGEKWAKKYFVYVRILFWKHCLVKQNWKESGWTYPCQG